MSSSRLAEKNKNPKLGYIHNPLIETTPIRFQTSEVKKQPSVLQVQDLMDSVVFGDPVAVKKEEKTDQMIKNTKENILNKVRTTQYNEVLSIEKLMMREIIEKDTEREKFLRDLMVKLELLQRENQILTAENNSLKEMMAIWNISS